MVKLSVFPKCYIEDICDGKMSLFEWIEMAESLEADGLELYFGFLQDHSSSYLAIVRKALGDKGFEMPMMCYSPDFTVVDKKQRQREIEKQKEVIAITAELGGSFCRILSGQKRPELSINEGVKIVIECIQACLETAMANNVTLVIENHYKDNFWKYPEFAQKMEVFLMIVNQIDSPFFGVQFDPSNSVVAAEDPIELLQQVKHKVKTVHASDRCLEEGTTIEDLREADGMAGYHSKLHHGIIGKGINDYDKIFSILKEVNFDGWISIEDGINGMEEMAESMVFLKQMRKKYFNAE